MNSNSNEPATISVTLTHVLRNSARNPMKSPEAQPWQLEPRLSAYDRRYVTRRRDRPVRENLSL